MSSDQYTPAPEAESAVPAETEALQAPPSPEQSDAAPSTDTQMPQEHQPVVDQAQAVETPAQAPSADEAPVDFRSEKRSNKKKSKNRYESIEVPGSPDENAAQDDAPAEKAADTFTFANLGLDKEIVGALTKLGYEEPTPIQREAIGPLLDGRDVLGQAATGTGKTAAFALPLLERILKTGGNKGTDPTGLVLVPTRELANQVSEAIHKYGQGFGATVLPVYGGAPISRQLNALKRGVDVVVATPGRALDLINRKALRLRDLQVLVLDEADEMLDMGFTEDLESIMNSTPEERQTVLFSATMPKRLERIANSHMTKPVRIELEREKPKKGEGPKIRQTTYIVPRSHKATALGRLLDQEQPVATIVFCRTRAEVDQLTETMNGRGYRAEAIHGGLTQEHRSRVLSRLKNGKTELLVATDVAARGLDIDNLSHVVNYDVPAAPEAYVHRIGRVGRAGREGVAITLAQPREHRQLKMIERLTGQKMNIEQVPTVADLRAKRLELTQAALRETLLQDDLESMRAVVESLGDEFDIVNVALAAVKMTHEAMGGPGEDEEDIPQQKSPFDGGKGRDGKKGKFDRDSGGDFPKRKQRTNSGPMSVIFVGAGRTEGVRPGDIVGAFTGESSLSGNDIGSITINDRYSLVEIPKESTDEVLNDLRNVRIKGRKANPRIDERGKNFKKKEFGGERNFKKKEFKKKY